MKDYMISMFIDDELEVDDKIEFVKCIYGHKNFTDETIDFLNQEKKIRSDVVYNVPEVRFKPKRKFNFPALRPLGFFASGAAAAMLLWVLLSSPLEISATSHRFVIYFPDAKRADIVGSFTGWNRIPMKKLGVSGYWEITMELPQGEHRYSYFIEGKQQVADPTNPYSEKDDFGGKNSILHVGV